MKNVVWGFIALISLSCASEVKKDTTKDASKDDAKKEAPIVKKEVSLEKVDLSTGLLVGTWIYEDVRFSPTEKGIAPVTPDDAKILIQINDKNQLALATEGLEELKRNMRGIPSNFTIDEDRLCCKGDIVFKIQFKSSCAKVVILNENEMVIEAKPPHSDTAMYKYYKRMK